MRHKILFFMLIFIFFLSSCQEEKEKENELIKIPYDMDIYITKDNRKMPYQFTFSNKIETFSISNIVTSNASRVEYKLFEEKEKINDNFYYGIVFSFEYKDFLFESFEITINEEYYEKIDINLNVITVSDSNQDIIYPLSIPFLGDFSNLVDWVLLPSKNIVIEDINVYDSLKCVKNVLINSIEFKRKSYDKLDKIYINVEFDYTNYDKVNFVYIQIKYIDEDGNSFVYNSDVAKFGNETTILINM